MTSSLDLPVPVPNLHRQRGSSSSQAASPTGKRHLLEPTEVGDLENEHWAGKLGRARGQPATDQRRDSLTSALLVPLTEPRAALSQGLHHKGGVATSVPERSVAVDGMECRPVLGSWPAHPTAQTSESAGGGRAPLLKLQRHRLSPLPSPLRDSLEPRRDTELEATLQTAILGQRPPNSSPSATESHAWLCSRGAI